MEPPSTPGEGLGDVGGNEEVPGVDTEVLEVDGTGSMLSEGENEQPIHESEMEETTAEEAVVDEGESPSKAADETTTSSEKDEGKDAATAIATDEAEGQQQQEVDNEGEALPLSATPDSMDFSMGIYSMDQPPKTPLLPSADALDLQTPKGASAISLERTWEEAETPSLDNTATTIDENVLAPIALPQFDNEIASNPSLLFNSISNIEGESSTITALAASSNNPAKTKTLAALFGGPSIGNAPGDYSISNLNNLAAQHDYTLVGDSPYETTYDPQSTFYYNRVYGQLYITTISIMFRGKAFGPIGAIPYERRLLLPFLEISEINAYKTTSVKITMNDGESYVFKSFANREAMVRLLRKTKKKCCESHKQRRHTTSIVSSNDIHPTPITNNRSLVENTIRITQSQHSDTASSPPSNNDQQQQQQQESRRSRTPTFSSQKQEAEVPRRSRSMPSSLRASKTKMSASKSVSTTPLRNSVFFYDDQAQSNQNNNKESSDTKLPGTPKTSDQKTPAPKSQQVKVGSLRLSLVDGEDRIETKSLDDLNRPRRLFELEPSAMVAANAAAAAVMLSPPRTTLNQRRQPKTPQVETPANANNKKNHQQVHRQDQQATTTPRDQSNKSIGTLASIPAIPTVPSLNTPEPSSQRVIQIEESRLARGKPIPLPIPEIDNDEPSPPMGMAPRVLAPITPIANHSPTASPEDMMVEKAWKSVLATNSKDWTVALESTNLPNCTLDEWFNLFFSDDATFSLARYQLEHVGDRDVSFSPWIKKPKQRSDEKKSETDAADNSPTSLVPELERSIRYIHPIGGSIGPSEAETFRIQSLKRYRNHGAILKNVTTVGKGIPMGDCFRVEDQWIIEKDNEQHNALIIRVLFKVVFLKRTMFKSIIQKNTVSETKKWFAGYSKMLQAALESPQHVELRKSRREEIIASPLSSAPSLSLSMRETSHKTAESLRREFIHDSPQSSSSVTATSDGHQYGVAEKKKKGAFKASIILVFLGGAVVLLLLLTILALWVQVRSVGSSLSVVDQKLSELQMQNTMLLQKLEELAVASAATTTTT